MKSRIASFLAAGLAAATIALGAGSALAAGSYPTTTDEARALAGKQQVAYPVAQAASRPAGEAYPTTTDEARAQAGRRQAESGATATTGTPQRLARDATTTDQIRGLY